MNDSSIGARAGIAFLMALVTFGVAYWIMFGGSSEEPVVETSQTEVTDGTLR